MNAVKKVRVNNMCLTEGKFDFKCRCECCSNLTKNKHVQEILSQWQDACGKFECAKNHSRTNVEQNNVTKSVFVFSKWRNKKQGNRLTPRSCNGDEF